MIRSITRNLFRLGAAVVLLALGLCAIEIALRAAQLHIATSHPGEHPLTEPSRTSYLDVVPLLETTVSEQDRTPFTLVTNSWGLRGPEIDVPKPRGTYRILCLGAEETFAAAVDEPNTYPALLERRLQASSSLRVEVLNGGCPEAGPLVNLLRWRRLMALQPDLVILTTSPFRSLRDQQVRHYLHLDEARRASHATHPRLQEHQSLLEAACHEFYTADWLARTLGQEVLLLSEKSSSGTQRSRADASPGDDVGARMAEAPLVELDELTKAVYANCVVSICPCIWDLGSTRDTAETSREVNEREQYRQIVLRLGQERAIPVCDMTDVFLGHPDLKRLYSPRSRELSPQGHQLYADQLSRFIVEHIPGAWTLGARGQQAEATGDHGRL